MHCISVFGSFHFRRGKSCVVLETVFGIERDIHSIKSTIVKDPMGDTIKLICFLFLAFSM